ncbi:hypothetical protein [Roseomonas chloroacetimidivorans]|uniref:hypothetical protein n=1 Tax=Roseomonas chloroacetimidivorans TaxID=1766656 RepID=UPI003C76EDFE
MAGALHDIELVDRLPAEWRCLVHEFGYSVVRAFYQAGIQKPATVRHLIRTVWLGSREPGNVQPNYFYGQKTHRTLDMLLAEGRISNVQALFSTLEMHGQAIVHRNPTDAMVQASIAATGKMGLVDKQTKHRERLRAAIAAGALKKPEVPGVEGNDG